MKDTEAFKVKQDCFITVQSAATGFILYRQPLWEGDMIQLSIYRKE